MSNDVDSFLIPVKQRDLSELETVVSFSVSNARQVARALVIRRSLELPKKNDRTALLSYRSIRCASQNTETVIPTFRQPTAAFISE